MQTTLLGLAIAMILALVAALAGPVFVPWSNYRSAFEAEASRVTGLPVRITGPIEARALPVPRLRLQGVEIGAPKSEPRASVRAVHVELSLGSLLRGEIRASELELDRPEISVGLDKSGRIPWLAAATTKPDPDGFSIEKFTIDNGRVALSDAGSGTRTVLDELWFSGDIRSLAGPIRGEGGFKANGQLYPYRINSSRIAADGTARLRLVLDPIGRPMADMDVTLSLANGQPHFEGTATVARAVQLDRSGGGATVIEPWRATAKIKGDPASAVLEQIELQYGPDEWAIRLKGDARVRFGAQPQFDGVLSTAQLDLDRILEVPEDARRRPLAALKALAKEAGGASRFPFGFRVGVTAEAITLAGATLQRVSGDFSAQPDGWDIEALDFRAPGLTQVRLSGKLNTGATGPVFTGPVRVEAADPRAFAAWLTDRADFPASGADPFRFDGEVTIGSDAVAVERLTADLGKVNVEGRLAYNWAAEGRAARLDASLRARELDVDRLAALVSGASGGASFDWPGEGSLSLEFGRAILAGTEVKDAALKMWLDPAGLVVERLAVGDAGGAALSGSGRIDTRGASPQGTMSLNVDARKLDGAIALAEQYSPAVANLLRRAGRSASSAKLQTTFILDAVTAGQRGTAARFNIDGRLGDIRLNLSGGAQSADMVSLRTARSALETAAVRMEGRVEADDAGVIVGLFGLDRIVASERKPGRLIFSASGPADGDLQVLTQLSGPGLDVKGLGVARLSSDNGMSAKLALDVGAASLRPPRSPRTPSPIPMKLKTQLAVDRQAVSLSNIESLVAGTGVRGNLTFVPGEQTWAEGDLDITALDIPAVLGSLTGYPVPAQAAAAWPSEPFAAGFFGQMAGRIKVSTGQASISPKTAVSSARAVLNLGTSDIAVEDFEGSVAGGRTAGSFTVHRDAKGLSLRGRLSLTNVDAVAVLPVGRALTGGRLTFDADVTGTGLSPAALIGSLSGAGTFKLTTAQVAGIDGKVFETTIRAVDLGLPLDANRIGERVDRTLSAGRVTLSPLEAPLTVSGGIIRLGQARARADGVELSLSGQFDLANNGIDARVSLVPPDDDGSPRPEIGINLKGPSDAPQRTLDAAVLTGWLALRAVEEQSKRLEALQARRDQPTPPPLAVPYLTAPVPMMPPPPLSDRPSSTAEAPRGIDQAPLPTLTSPDLAPPVTPPETQAAPPLPPPIDIPPAPSPRSPRAESATPPLNPVVH